jgi:predicted acetyltransferase
MELVTPDIKYKDSFIEALETGFNALYVGSQEAMSNEAVAGIKNDFETYLTAKVLKPYDPTPKLRDDGNYYPNAPQIPYWLVDNGKFIGIFLLRTELNGFLMYVGGNVGYGIAPKYRRMGYATKGLGLLIEKARNLNMSRLLIAARDDNIGSWKAIEKNGGMLENIITLPWENSGQKYKRYWVEIGK